MSRSLIIIVVLLTSGCRSNDPPEDYSGLLKRLADHGPLRLDQKLASRFSKLSLECIDREYPNKPSNVLDGDETVKPPRELTPVFFGCFDWHSAVHGHWALVRLLKTFPALPEAAAIRERLEKHLTAEKIKHELSYFQHKRNRLFERPYGWGWLLRLSAELHGFDDPDARRWSEDLRPLSEYLAGRSIAYLNRLSVPVRHGDHPNTAFAMAHMLDYASSVGDQELLKTVTQRAKDFYLTDRNCPTDYEPSGEDFISPCLVEADLMRRVLDRREFVTWLDGFLPRPESEAFAPLLTPVTIKDIRDGKIGHLIGLALQRAWSFKALARALPAEDPRAAVFVRLSDLHRHEALRQMFESGYGGEHWLASFAIYLLTGPGR